MLGEVDLHEEKKTQLTFIENINARWNLFEQIYHYHWMDILASTYPLINGAKPLEYMWMSCCVYVWYNFVLRSEVSHPFVQTTMSCIGYRWSRIFCSHVSTSKNERTSSTMTTAAMLSTICLVFSSLSSFVSTFFLHSSHLSLGF